MRKMVSIRQFCRSVLALVLGGVGRVVVITSHLDTLLGINISPLLKVPLTKMIFPTSRERWDISDRYIVPLRLQIYIEDTGTLPLS